MVSGIPEPIASPLRISFHLGDPTSMNILDEEKKLCAIIPKAVFSQFQKSAHFLLI